MIPFFKPTIRRSDMDAVLQRLANDAIGAGGASSELAQNLAQYLGKRDGIAVRSIRTALRTALDLLELGAGEQVGLSVLAPVGWYDAISSLGFKPVAIDVAVGSPVFDSPLNVDYSVYNLGAMIVDTRTGLLPDLVTFPKIGVPVIEVISEGLGSFVGEGLAGTFGDVAVIGLEPEHILTAGGGAVCVSDSRKKLASVRDKSYVFDETLPDMNAALGLTQFRNLPLYIERRQELAKRYTQALLPTGNKALNSPGDGEIVYQCLPVRISASPMDVQKYAKSHGVSTASLGSGSILERFKNESDAGAEPRESVAQQFPNAVAVVGNTVLFPLYPAMSKSEQEKIIQVLATLP